MDADCPNEVKCMQLQGLTGALQSVPWGQLTSEKLTEQDELNQKGASVNESSLPSSCAMS